MNIATTLTHLLRWISRILGISTQRNPGLYSASDIILAQTVCVHKLHWSQIIAASSSVSSYRLIEQGYNVVSKGFGPGFNSTSPQTWHKVR